MVYQLQHEHAENPHGVLYASIQGVLQALNVPLQSIKSKATAIACLATEDPLPDNQATSPL
jgi:hypothetical protein